MQPNTYFGGGVQGQFTPTKPKSRRKLIIIIGLVLISLVAVLGALSAISGGSSSKASDVSKKMVELIGEGDGVGSYELLSPSGKRVSSREEWVVFVVANKDKLSPDQELKLVYVKDMENKKREEGYNIGSSGSIHRIKIIVDQDEGLIDSISINKTAL